MHKNIIKDEWFSAYYIKDGIWRISDNCQDNIYLVIGEDKALLIDTGWGVGNLPEFAGKITSLPLVAANTHGHFDHALGNDSFDYVYVGEQDSQRFSSLHINEKRNFAKNSKLLTEVKTMTEFDNWGTHARKQDIILHNMQQIELGGRTLTAYLTPGHTKGGVCFLDKKAGVLFTGDSFIPSDAWGPAWFHLKESALLSEFYEKMSSVTAGGGFDYLLTGHGECGLIPLENILIFLNGIKGIIDGKICGIQEKTFAGDGLRCDWKGSSIVYDPGKLK